MTGARVNQPSNQIKLTNVSIVRLKKARQHFEIACYKNKILEFRSGADTDLDNILQVHNVFLNVSRGQTAPRAQLQKAFGKDASQDDIILEILKKGEIQVGEEERAEELSRIHAQVVQHVTSRLVDPKTDKCYPPTVIEKCLDMMAKPGPDGKPPVWTGVVTSKLAKAQALDAIKALISTQIIPVKRMRMQVAVTCSTEATKEKAKGILEKVESESKEEDGKVTISGSLDPSVYRDLLDLMKKENGGKVEIIKQGNEGDE